MFISKPLFIGAVIVLCVIGSALVLNCSGTRTKALVDNQAGGVAERLGTPNATRDAAGGVASQGGTLTEAQLAESDESAADDAPNGGDEATPGQSAETDKGGEKSKIDEGKLETFVSQLSRYKYEKFEPTEEMIANAIVGFYRMDGAKYISGESSGLKSEQAEIYDLWFKMPEGTDYKKTVDTYAAKLETGYAKQQMDTDKGAATYFVTQEPKKWNKVIIIFQSYDEPGIKIRVKFDKLLK